MQTSPGYQAMPLQQSSLGRAWLMRRRGVPSALGGPALAHPPALDLPAPATPRFAFLLSVTTRHWILLPNDAHVCNAAVEFAQSGLEECRILGSRQVPVTCIFLRQP